jgi:hypothetical protein
MYGRSLSMCPGAPVEAVLQLSGCEDVAHLAEAVRMHVRVWQPFRLQVPGQQQQRVAWCVASLQRQYV